MRIVLASQSPRRKELLSMIGASFDVLPADVDETVSPSLSPLEAVCEISRRKAEKVLSLFPGEEVFVIAADTVVAAGGEMLGKPKDETDAVRMLKMLSGSHHAVYTGYTVGVHGRIVTDCEKTDVYFRTLSEEEIYRYTKTGAPMDKAGAYGIQGKAAVFVEKLDGDYFNVMGLPICALCRTAKEHFGVTLASF